MATLDTGTGRLVTVRLYGVLGSKFGRVHRLAVSSAAEAVRALGSQIRGFDAFLTQSKDKGLAYAIFYGKTNIDKEQLALTCGEGKDIRIAPIVIGSKNGGWFSIILGAVLIIAGYVLAPFTDGASLMLVPMGWSMVAGGIVQLLTPVPKGQSSQDRPDNRPNYAFNGPVNTQAQGGCVPVLYGELIVGSAVISAGINVSDQMYVPSGTTGIGYGGGGGGGARLLAVVE